MSLSPTNIETWGSHPHIFGLKRATLEVFAHSALFLTWDQPECLPRTYSIAVSYHLTTTASFGADILAIGGLQSYIAVAQIDELERLPGTDGIAVSYHLAATAAFRTDILAIEGLQSYIAVAPIYESESLPGTDNIAVSYDLTTAATFCTDILAIESLKGNRSRQVDLPPTSLTILMVRSSGGIPPREPDTVVRSPTTLEACTL